MTKIVVYGASGHGKVVAEAARVAGIEVYGFCDDDPEKRGMKLLNSVVNAVGIEEVEELCKTHDLRVAFGVGENAGRRRLFERVMSRGIGIATVIHPSAIVAPSAQIGRGVVVFGGVVVNADAIIEDGVILNTACSVDHDNHIGSFAHLSPGAHLGGTVIVGDETHVGIGACVRNNVSIGSRCVIGAGASVVGDIPDGVVAIGVPARILKSKK